MSEGGLGITRAYIYHVTAKETAGAHLLTMHNVHYQLNLMKEAREAIIQDRYPQFVKDFLASCTTERRISILYGQSMRFEVLA